jgi:hypothetical protein
MALLVLLLVAAVAAGLLAARPGLLAALGGAYRAQLALQQRYSDRYERSGAEALAATRALRWRGDALAGELVPPAGLPRD